MILQGCAGAKDKNKELALKGYEVEVDKMKFSCAHEQIVPASAEVNVLFDYARWLQKGNQLKRDPDVNREVERLYRIASENGHFKANINLQNGAMRGAFKLKGDAHLRMSQQLIDANVATGYYFIATFLRQGGAGLREDQEMSLQYYRKAADLGSAAAQYRVGNLLAPINIAPKIAMEMWLCAAEQGHGGAAVDRGISLQIDGDFKAAMESFQLGVAAGHENAASFLSKGFNGVPPSNDLYYLGLDYDEERASRYRKIGTVLGRNSYANPVVPEINDIVPLPPAKLPPWDGKLKWLEERLANVPPPKPSEALIRKLADAQLLEPDTGLPKPGSAAFVKAEGFTPSCRTGEQCPQAGYWQVSWIYGQDPVGLVDAGTGGRQIWCNRPSITSDHPQPSNAYSPLLAAKASARLRRQRLQERNT
jgi:TPR repeat protein